MNLNQVTVGAKDVDRSIAFYEKLGLKLIVKALPHYARFECPTGDATFSLHEVKEINSNNSTSVYFECEDLDERVKNLVAAGIVFDEPPSDRTWLWREARLKDPDGNKLILYRAGEHRKNPPWRVK